MAEPIAAALQARSTEFAPGDLHVRAVVVMAAKQGVATAAMLERPELLAPGVLQEELTALALRYLGWSGPQP